VEKTTVKRHIVPPRATIEELKQKATDCERKAAKTGEPEATKLRQEALRYRKWIAALRSGLWKS
jgi:hypothetical protein